MKSRGPLLALLLGVGTLAAGASLLGRLDTAPPLAASPARPSETPTGRMVAAPVDDPELLAAWFQAEVMRELERSSASEGRAPVGVDAVGHQDTRETRLLASLIESGRSERVDWGYLEDVFDGRVRGIPNERRAGLTLQEMDELGEVPYLEELREEGRFDEVAELGVEQEPAPANCPHQIAPGPRRDWMCGRWVREARGCPNEIPPGPRRDQVCWSWKPPTRGRGVARADG
jgi:hypothetical protein